MKLLVIATLAACALAKPVEKPLEKRQLDGYPFNAQFGQNVQFDQTQFGARSFPSQFGLVESQSEKAPLQLNEASQFGLGSNGASFVSNGAIAQQAGFSQLNNVQPEITNVGNSGLNSNGVVSTSTISPLDAFSLPTSTFSPINTDFNSLNTINAGQSFSSLPQVSSVGNSQLFPDNLVSSVTPLPQISSTFSPSTFASFSANPTPLPVVSSTAAPVGLLESRLSSDNFFLDNSHLQGLDLSQYNLNGLNFQGSFDLQSNLNTDKYLTVQSDKTPEVTKSIYFYEAPEEPEPVRQRKIVQLPPQKTNYKLLFIKAPSAPELQPIEIPAQLQNNEKTRVYVLVKKPDTEQQIKIVQGPAPQTEKPEVFYIKYKTREEAEKAIKEAQAGVALGKQSLNVDGQQLISSIKNSKVESTGNNFLVKSAVSHSVPSVPLNLFESSTALPFVSTTGFPFVSSTGGLGGFYDSSTANSLLNAGSLNQVSLYNNPALLSSNNLFSNGNNLFSNGNNLFSNGDFRFRSNNQGSFGGINLTPNSYVSSGFSNIPSFVDLSQRSQFGFRSGRIDNSDEKTSTTTSLPFGNTLDVIDKKKTEENKDEPFQLNIGGSDSTTSNSLFTNAAESSSTTETVNFDSRLDSGVDSKDDSKVDSTTVSE